MLRQGLTPPVLSIYRGQRNATTQVNQLPQLEERVPDDFLGVHGQDCALIP